MKALVKEHPAPGLSIRDIEEPQIQNTDDVKFKVEFCAICVGETKVYDWNEWAANDPTLELPTVLGHEAAGVVTKAGSDVSVFKPGDRITVDPFIHCGYCYQCRSGHHNMCVDREIYGKRRGAFAEYAILPERSICKIPDTLSLEEGAVLENFGIAMHAVETEAHDPGDLAVVIGCGPIGVLAAKTLMAEGVNVVLTDLKEWRLRAAEKISGCTVFYYDAQRDQTGEYHRPDLGNMAENGTAHRVEQNRPEDIYYSRVAIGRICQRVRNGKVAECNESFAQALMKGKDEKVFFRPSSAAPWAL